MSHPLVETVVTLDSPLMGMASGEVLVNHILGLIGLRCDGPVLDQLASFAANRFWPQVMETLVDRLQERGGRIATLGNEQDCVYDPILCPEFCVPLLVVGCLLFSDERATQIIPNANVAALYPLGVGDTHGHDEILSDLDIANFIASFIGPP
jgi:hypothetical protein